MGRGQAQPLKSTRGATLIELLTFLTIVATLTALGLTGLRGFREASAIQAATRSARNHLVLARSMALARRETMRVRVDGSGDLVIVAPSDELLSSASVGPSDELALDSLRIRPSTLRFNSRGQAAPGSVYLYRGDRVVRIVSNFLGRLRIESFRSR
jgi:type II secretory pathway pseudopilin PulG